MFSVVLDKMCFFCLYPILDSQQCVKRGSYRRPILSGLLVSFLIFVGPWARLCQDSSLGLEPLSFVSFIYLIKPLSHFVLNCVSYFGCFVINYVLYFKYFVFNCDSYLNVVFMFKYCSHFNVFRIFNLIVSYF